MMWINQLRLASALPRLAQRGRQAAYVAPKRICKEESLSHERKRSP